MSQEIPQDLSSPGDTILLTGEGLRLSCLKGPALGHPAGEGQSQGPSQAARLQSPRASLLLPGDLGQILVSYP